MKEVCTLGECQGKEVGLGGCVGEYPHTRRGGGDGIEFSGWETGKGDNFEM